MRFLTATFVLPLLLVGCAGKPAAADAAASTVAAAAPGASSTDTKFDAASYEHFGTGISASTPAVDVAAAVAQPNDFTGKTVCLSGSITGVCQTKGCWMTLGAGKSPVFVKFKDYAFFVPKDATGRNAVIEGTLTMKQETVEETKHYLEDAGKNEEAAKVTEGRKLYHFMASGVAIQKPAK